MGIGPESLEALETLLITDGRGDPARILRVARAALAAGIRAVQLREPGMTASGLASLCEKLRPELDAAHGLLLVNDRADIVAAGLAHGVHLGHRSLAPAAVRAFLPRHALVGYSAHGEQQMAAGQVADYVILAPLYPTTSKPGAAHLGLARASVLIAASERPVVVLGGIDVTNAAAARGIGACGVAVMSAVCDASDPFAAAAELVGTTAAHRDHET